MFKILFQSAKIFIPAVSSFLFRVGKKRREGGKRRRLLLSAKQLLINGCGCLERKCGIVYSVYTQLQDQQKEN